MPPFVIDGGLGQYEELSNAILEAVTVADQAGIEFKFQVDASSTGSLVGFAGLRLSPRWCEP